MGILNKGERSQSFSKKSPLLGWVRIVLLTYPVTCNGTFKSLFQVASHFNRLLFSLFINACVRDPRRSPKILSIDYQI